MPVGLGHALLHGTGEGHLHSIHKLCSAEPLKIHSKRLEFIVAAVWAPCLSLDAVKVWLEWGGCCEAAAEGKVGNSVGK